ncbi:DUF1800 domain-containing protein [Parasediminibacterium paludis]|uniref:DUF1800 domain-containing protein n=1 Tax=Parasediminibacterium paludis TaxID=908966 RepID=A0ABV8PVZ2_9BACT
MKQLVKVVCSLLFLTAIVSLSSYTNENTGYRSIKFPYKKAGFTQREAAAHLLSRFTFGATPGQIDEVVDEGVEKWFAEQLEAKLPDDSLQQKLASYDALQMDNNAIINKFPQGGILLRLAVKDGFIDKDSVNKADRKEYRDKIAEYMRLKGYKPQQELYRQLINQKILRAAYTNNQLQEVLTSFWFNHFNVSLTKNECADFVLAYERDVIRPNVLGKFEDLLLATAKSPAMLNYLDNAKSVANDNTPIPPRLAAFYAKIQKGEQMGNDSLTMQQMAAIDKFQKAKKTQGLNENYAREIMELHTLGVDGGYTQTDVTNAAKVLTGWTIYPTLNPYGGEAAKKALDRIGEDKLIQQGFVHDGDFAFAANKHDKTEKVVLGKTFVANGGYDEGLQLIKLLAHHTSTARFISKKLAVRFVNDNPPTSLIDKMSKTFLNSDGDIKKVLITMVSSPEFWSKDALREKTKSPFELAISAVRGLNATISQPYQIYNWVSKMGERMYYYQAPTGFPDKGEYWINTGSLLNRMNFGLALASQRIPGVTFNLASLNNNHEPESAEAALSIYSKLLMPERDVTQTIKRLTPLINDPDIHTKIANAASTSPVPQAATTDNAMMGDNMMANTDIASRDQKTLKENPGKKTAPEIPLQRLMAVAGNNSMLSQVTGIIIGSPEFQRK